MPRTTEYKERQPDRRQLEMGPPAGWGERRRRVERRLPVAEETEVSAEDWERFFGAAARTAQPDRNIITFDLAAEVFDRVRDR
jgi:hypothetical protein